VNELPDKAKALISKVSRLVKSGATGGEKIAARAALERIAKTHNITLEQLDLCDDRVTHHIPLSKHWQKYRLITQLVIKKYFPEVTLSEKSDFTDKQGNVWEILIVQMSDLDHAVLTELSRDYLHAWKQHEDEVFAAWSSVQGLLPQAQKADDGVEVAGTSEKTDREALERMRAQTKLVKKINTKRKLK
jgi:hypothetical protein